MRKLKSKYILPKSVENQSGIRYTKLDISLQNQKADTVIIIGILTRNRLLSPLVDAADIEQKWLTISFDSAIACYVKVIKIVLNGCRWIINFLKQRIFVDFNIRKSCSFSSSKNDINIFMFWRIECYQPGNLKLTGRSASWVPIFITLLKENIPAEVWEQLKLGDAGYRMNILLGHFKKAFRHLLRLHYLF